MEYKPTQSYIEKRSAGMALAALVLGIIGVILGLCPFIGFILGSLAIILGVLSRGGEMTMSLRAKISVILGSIGIGLSCIGIFLIILIASYNNTTIREDYHFYDHYDDGYYDYFDDWGNGYSDDWGNDFFDNWGGDYFDNWGNDYFDDNGGFYSDDWYNDFELDDTF